MSDKTLIQQLAEWIISFDVGQLSPEVSAHAKHLLLDSIGCALAAHDHEAFEAARAATGEIGGMPRCTVIGTGELTSLPAAVLLNGALIRALDMNDIYMGPGQNGHPSDNMAVALSVAESERSTGEELLAAIVLGYEIYGRLEDLAHHASPWDHVTVSNLVAPAIAGRLMQLDATVLANALAISATQGNTLAAVRSGQLSGAKNLANALVATHAVLGTLLAKHGLTGPMEILESPRGAGKAVYAGADLRTLVQPATAPFRILDVSIKAFPCIGTAQTIAAAAVESHGLLSDPAEITEVKIRLADVPFVKGQLEDQERRYPRTRETADHSFYYLAAAALLDGAISVETFKKDRWLDEDMNAMMQRITLTADDSLNVHVPGTFPCVMEITTRAGERKTVEMIHAPGSVKNRMTTAQVQEKFRGNCGARVTKAHQQEIIGQVMELEKLGSVAELMKNLHL
jgi:2-methylcitrate dehydratase